MKRKPAARRDASRIRRIERKAAIAAKTRYLNIRAFD